MRHNPYSLERSLGGTRKIRWEKFGQVPCRKAWWQFWRPKWTWIPIEFAEGEWQAFEDAATALDDAEKFRQDRDMAFKELRALPTQPVDE